MLNKLLYDAAGALRNTFSTLKEEKFFGTGSLVQFMPNQKYQGQEDYITVVKNGYNRNGQVFACVDYRARAFASASWYIYRKDLKGKKEILKKDKRNLLFVSPNKTQSWHEFAYEWQANILLAGENYSKKAIFMGQVAALWNLLPYMVQVNVGATPQDIISYTFGINQPTQFTEKAEVIMREKTFNPLDQFHGISRVRIGSLTIDQSNFSKEWNTQLMQNSGRPDGIFTLEGDITEEQRLSFKQEIRRKFSGKDNAGKPLVAGGKWNYTPLSMPAKDMEWLDTTKKTDGDICTIFQVPAILIGDSDNKTYSNYGEARKHFAEDVAYYDLVRARNTLNSNVLTEEERADGVCIDFDVSQLPAYKESENELVDRLEKRSWWTPNEKREAEGKEPLDDEEANKLDTQRNNNNQQPENNTPSKPGKKQLPLFGALNIQTKQDKIRYTKQFDGERVEFTKAVYPIIQKQFKREMNGIVKTMKKSGNPEAFIDDFNGYLEKSSPQWEAILANVAKGVSNQFLKRTFNSLKSLPRNTETKADGDQSIQSAQDQIDLYIKNVTGEKVKEINATTLNKLKDIVSTGLTDGSTIFEYQKAIEALYLDKMIPNRSEVIARTEVIAASNLGSKAMAENSGLVLEKEWSDAGDSRVRHSHEAMNGKRLPLDENWVINGKELAFPGDSSLGALPKDTIQCRCIELYHETVKED